MSASDAIVLYNDLKVNEPQKGLVLNQAQNENKNT